MSSSFRSAVCLIDLAGFRRLAVALAGFGAVIAATPTGSVDWSSSGTLTQTFTARERFGQDENNDETDLTSQTNLGVSIVARTPTTTWRLAPSLSLSARNNADGDTDDIVLNPSFRGQVNRRGPRLGVQGDLSVRPRFVSSRELVVVDGVPEIGGGDNDDAQDDEPGDDLIDDDPTQRPTFRDVDPLEIRIDAGLDFNYTVDPRNSATLGFDFDAREFSETSEEFQPSRNFGSTLQWRRRLDTTSSASLGLAIRYFTDEDDDSSDTVSLTPTLGYSEQLTPRHSGSVNIGASFLESRDGSEDSEVLFNGGAGLSYRGSGYSGRVRFTQSVNQDDDGDVVGVARLSGSLNLPLTSRAGFSLTGRVSADRPIFDATDFEEIDVVISPNFRYRLSPDWALRVGYSLRTEFNRDGETEGDNRVFLTLTRAIDVLR